MYLNILYYMNSEKYWTDRRVSFVFHELRRIKENVIFEITFIFVEKDPKTFNECLRKRQRLTRHFLGVFSKNRISLCLVCHIW